MNNSFVESEPQRMHGMPYYNACSLSDVLPGTGVAVMIAGQQIAIIRTRDTGQVYALSNFDPFSKAFVIARGIVGDRGGIPKVASPIFKQSFDLRTGRCLDDPNVSLPVYPVRVVAGRIEVQVPPLVEA
ncbi:MAG TPA: nitrite reductase small subunit NirD [Polyangiaceae bacterium]|nr:nitrite reductase small subunit NirD [Polyangiaceae bacterium]